MLGFVLRSPGKGRTRAVHHGPTSGSPSLGKSWATEQGRGPQHLKGVHGPGCSWVCGREDCSGFSGPKHAVWVSLPLF